MSHILIIEDDQNLGHSLKERLEKEGYIIDWAESLGPATEKLAKKPALIILDWMLPDGQGLDFLTQIRKEKNQTPIIFLTAKVDLVDKVLGLEMGANDYITKPFETRELLARIRVQLRERVNFSAAPITEMIQVGPLSIDRQRFKVTFKDKEVPLVKKEFELLTLLAENPEKVFSRDEILNKVWGYDVFPTTRTVDTHIMILRQKTEESLIETVRAVGYRLKVL